MEGTELGACGGGGWTLVMKIDGKMVAAAMQQSYLVFILIIHCVPSQQAPIPRLILYNQQALTILRRCKKCTT